MIGKSENSDLKVCCVYKQVSHIGVYKRRCSRARVCVLRFIGSARARSFSDKIPKVT